MDNSEFPAAYSAATIHKAAEQLKAGHLVAFPTETVYGLGADATNEHAVKRIYDAKGRPSNHPLIVHVASMRALDLWAQNIPDYAIELARIYWPGPMTLILKRTNLASDFITGGQDSVGIRVPSNSIALELLSQFELLGGYGVAAPSANRFSQVSPTSFKDVVEEIGEYLTPEDLILDGGRSSLGIESTIIDCTYKSPRVLRLGHITFEMIEKSVGQIDFEIEKSAPRTSGNFKKHYAPKARVLIDTDAIPGQGLIALELIPTPRGVIRILSPKNTRDFAYSLYSGLRKVDKLGLTECVVILPKGSGLEAAIRDRVIKAKGGV